MIFLYKKRWFVPSFNVVKIYGITFRINQSKVYKFKKDASPRLIFDLFI